MIKPTEIMKEKIYIKTNRIGFIPQLGIQGPLVNPYPVTRATAKELVVAGIEVYEVKNNKEVEKLTLQNVFPGEGDPVKPEPKKQQAAPVEPPVTPVTIQGIPADAQKEEKKEDAVKPAVDNAQQNQQYNNNGKHNKNKK